jgi:hypothetical protein
MTVLMESTKYVEETLRPGVRFVNFISKLHPFIYTTKSSDFSNFCGVIGYNFFLL